MNEISKVRKWTSFILQGAVTLPLSLGVVNSILQTEDAVNNSKQLGHAETTLLPLGLVLAACILLFAVPRTSILGAILLTAWFGGAVATHVIHGDSFVIISIPAIFGILTWLSIWLRDDKLRSLIPIK